MEFRRVLFRSNSSQCCAANPCDITLSEVSDVTGISRATLTRIANVPGNVTNTDTINALCKYFACQPGELLIYVEDEPSVASTDSE